MKNKFISCIILLIFFTSLAPSLALASEADVLNETLARFYILGETIKGKWVSDGGLANTPLYPANEGGPCWSSYETLAPCWAKPLTKEGQGKMMVDLLGDSHSNDLDVDTRDLHGDVRFRCRTQGRHTYCSAYYCCDKSPAGCRQVWRIDWEVNPHDINGKQAKCVKTMGADAIDRDLPGENWSEVCTDWFRSNPSTWP